MLILEKEQFKENKIYITPSQTRELIADLTRNLEEALDHLNAFPCSVKKGTEEGIVFMVLPRERRKQTALEKT